MGVRIHKRGNTYHARVTIDGIEYRRTLKTGNEREAKKRAFELEAEIRRAMVAEDEESAGKKATKRLPFSGFVRDYPARFGTLETLAPAGPLAHAFRERLHSPQGVPFEEALFEAILAVDAAIAFLVRDLQPPGFRRAFPTAKPGVLDLVWASGQPSLSRAAAAAGLRGVVELLPPEL